MDRSNLGGLCLGLMLGGTGRKGHHVQTKPQQHHCIFTLLQLPCGCPLPSVQPLAVLERKPMSTECSLPSLKWLACQVPVQPYPHPVLPPSLFLWPWVLGPPTPDTPAPSLLSPGFCSDSGPLTSLLHFCSGKGLDLC